AVPREVLEAQVEAALGLGPVHAVKWGMVPDRATLGVLTRALARVRAPWVVDPVVATSKGEPLTSLKPRDYLALASSHVVVTPNLDEAAWLLGWDGLGSVEDAVEAGRALVARGFRAALVKGGHQPGAAVDVVCTSRDVALLRARRLGGESGARRGKGCRFGSAMAVALARDAEVHEAARSAKRFVSAYLKDG
ncbi:MAG: hydroxymethylpyrimidine/phosphomethylpyrimidine kinase, partial [Myxococcaceae bacterium]|nr:hydroxymethylpyrimidine/phosphomethylpyrimidine kinase [Myxococcaceae bacterium]